MKVIVISNQKGGVLKSTTALSLSINLSRFGKRVLLIDFDPQHSLSDTFLDDREIENKAIHKVLLEIADIKNCIALLSPTLSFIPSDLELEQFPSKIIALGMVNQYILADRLDDIKNDYDYTILDCPPNNSYLNILALSSANIVIIPTHKSNWTRKGTEFVIDSIKELKNQKRSHVHIEKIILLPTAINRRKRALFNDKEFKAYTEDIRKQFENGFVKVSGITIPHDERASDLENVSIETLETIKLSILDIYRKFITTEGL